MFSTKRIAALILSLSAVPAIAAGTAATPSVDTLDCAKPDYPIRWQNEGDSGSVVVAFLVGADGRVVDSKIVQSSGYVRVDRASVRAVERCKFAAAPAGQAWSKVRYSWVME
jgi:protein TonB